MKVSRKEIGKKCPKCEGLLAVETSCVHLRDTIYSIVCLRCGIRGRGSFVEKLANVDFERQHGLASLSLEEIYNAGGPCANNMRRWLKEGRYPDAYRRLGRTRVNSWVIPGKTASGIIHDWKHRLGLVPLAVAAKRCGRRYANLLILGKRGYFPLIEKKGKEKGRYFVTQEVLQHLERFYCGTISSARVAEILQLRYYNFVHVLIAKRGLPYLRLGKIMRFDEKEVRAFAAKHKS